MQEFRVSYGQQEILSRTVSHLITVMQEEMMQMDLQQNKYSSGGRMHGDF